ncbi:MAG: DUF393 domain-containing protein [Flavobacteriaceae bacterium]|nr:DUF393 domain-containing protein [Flavobacteriaceae bacterium]
MMNQPEKHIVFFDGHCNLCSNSVQFIIKRDKKKRFVFASLQSDAASAHLLQFGLKNKINDSIILAEGGERFEKSEAALRIAKHLSPPWPVSYLFMILPRNWRDAVYDLDSEKWLLSGLAKGIDALMQAPFA